MNKGEFMKEELRPKEKEKIAEIAQISVDISEMISEVEILKEENKKKE